MTYVVGMVKIQYGILRIHEIDNDGIAYMWPNSHIALGYAIFNLNHQRVSRIFKDFEEVINEAEHLTLILHAGGEISEID